MTLTITDKKSTIISLLLFLCVKYMFSLVAFKVFLFVFGFSSVTVLWLCVFLICINLQGFFLILLDLLIYSTEFVKFDHCVWIFLSAQFTFPHYLDNLPEVIKNLSLFSIFFIFSSVWKMFVDSSTSLLIFLSFPICC